MSLSRADFSAFYRRTITPLRKYLARLLGNASDAQDLAHDAYARVLPAMKERDLQQPNAFLFQTARRLAFNELRHRRVAATTSLDNTALDNQPGHNPDIRRVVIARQELALLETALAELPPGCRTVLLLRKVDLLSHDEIALKLGISRSAVEKHCYRAVRLLREHMAKQGEPNASAEKISGKQR